MLILQEKSTSQQRNELQRNKTKVVSLSMLILEKKIVLIKDYQNKTPKKRMTQQFLEQRNLSNAAYVLLNTAKKLP